MPLTQATHVNGAHGAAATAGVVFGIVAAALGVSVACLQGLFGPAPAGSYTRAHVVQTGAVSAVLVALAVAAAYALGVLGSRSTNDGRGLARLYDTAAGVLVVAVVVSNGVGGPAVLPSGVVYLLGPAVLGLLRRPVCALAGPIG